MISVVWTDRAQFVVCRGCGAVAGPRELLNVMDFILSAKSFEDYSLDA